MDAHIRLKSRLNVVGSVSDFAYKWSMNAGLWPEDAARFSLALDELVTDVVLFSFRQSEGEFEITFRRDMSKVEAVIRDYGEPFDFEKYTYDPEKVLKEGNFQGAGLELIKHLADDFIFLNRGRDGKEFRIVKDIVSEHIADIIPEEEIKIEEPPSDVDYRIMDITPDHAEDISKLIYRNYGHTYVKEEMYFPKKIALALERRDKFGVVVYSNDDEIAGNFAVLKTTDSRIGEIGEAVVAVSHRKRGLMTWMLEELIKKSSDRGILAIFGEAVTVHDISQRVNLKFDMQSTALLLATFPAAKYMGIIEDYPQSISICIDFLMLNSEKEVDVYLPPEYADILKEIYGLLGIKPNNLRKTKTENRAYTDYYIHIDYDYRNGLMVIRKYGDDFRKVVMETVKILKAKKLGSIYLDLPLHEPETKSIIPELKKMGFLFAGLMPLFHKEKDYLRMQIPFVPIDLKHIVVFSDMSKKIKAQIAAELK